jgi:hypothetical protein
MVSPLFLQYLLQRDAKVRYYSRDREYGFWYDVDLRVDLFFFVREKTKDERCQIARHGFQKNGRGLYWGCLLS